MKPSAVYILRRRGGLIRRKRGTRVIYVGKSVQGVPPVPPWTRLQQHRTGNYKNLNKRRYKRRARYAKWWFKYLSVGNSTYHWIRIIPSKAANPNGLRWIGSEPLSLLVEKILITVLIPMGNIEHNWSYPIRASFRYFQRKITPKRFAAKFNTAPGEIA